MFNQESRLINDQCGYTLKNKESMEACNYTLTNFHTKNCNMTNIIDFATAQPSIFYKGGHQTGMNGCNIKENSELLIGGVQTHPKCRISLQSRPYLTVPYLGKGPGNCDVETKILHANQDNHKKSVQCSSEKSYIPYLHYPLLEPIKQKITNPKHLVEEDASSGWIRGGVSTRDLTRQKNFAEQHNKYQYS